MTKRVFITGITGFAGSWLAEYLLAQNNCEVSGTFLSEESIKNIESAKDKVRLFKLDLNDFKNTEKIISDVKPDAIFHLAALSSPADSFLNPSLTITNNVNAQVNLLEGLKNAKLSNSKILIASSADVYGMVPKEDLPIDENTPFKPVSPYAVSKITQDFLGLQYFLSYNLNIIRVRPFSHIGPKQAPGFVVSSICKKIAEIESGKIEPVLYVGNVDSKRDFTDVRDMVQAYSLMIEKGKSGEVYNIGTDKSYRIFDIINILISFSKKSISIKIDPKLLRPGDSPELLCDSRKMRELTSWQPEIPIGKSLKDTLDYWRNIV